MTHSGRSIVPHRAKRWSFAIVTALTLLASLPQTAVAADAVEADPYGLSIGAYFVTRTNGTLRLDRSAGISSVGTTIDWERDLGGETSMTVPRIDGYYRFAPKHRIDFSWYKVERNGTSTAQRDIEFGNISIPAGTSFLQSRLDNEIVKATYTYSFYRAPQIETALSVGLHVTKLEGALQTPGGLAEATSVTAPLPVFGVRLDYSFAPKWWARTKYELFFLDSVDKYQGGFSDFTFAIEHQTFKHLGFGFGLNRSSLDLEVDEGDKQGAFRSVLNGLMLYVAVR